MIIDFENFQFYIPSKYDEILKICYGNYLELPPLEERITHHSFDVYWKS